MTVLGLVSSTRGSCAVCSVNASTEMPMPGAMAPPRKSPSADTAVKVVAVPKSTTMAGPPYFSWTAMALQMRSAPTSLGCS